MVKLLTAMKWMIQSAFCFIPFEAVINKIFDDSAVEYIAYLLFAVISSVFTYKLSSKLGKVVGFEEKIMQPTIQGIMNRGSGVHYFIEHALSDVTATKTYTKHKTFLNQHFKENSRKNRIPLRIRRNYSRKMYMLQLALLKSSVALDTSSFEVYTTVAT